MGEPNYKKGGLINDKYEVRKWDRNESVPTDPDAQYFVLRVDKDPHARKALREYAMSVHFDNEEFAKDLFKWLKALEK